MRAALRLLATLLSLGGAAQGAASAASPASGEFDIRITGLAPQPPLDPYRPFELRFEIVNRGRGALQIADINALALLVTDAEGKPLMSRMLAHPQTLEQLQRARRSKRREVPKPVTIEAGGLYKGTFRTLDAVGWLRSGPVRISLRLPLPDGAVLASGEFFAPVDQPPAMRMLETAMGKSQEGTSISQSLHVLPSRGRARWVLMSSLYPPFESVVFDGEAPAGTGSPMLPVYWPAGLPRLMVGADRAGAIEIFEVVNPPPYDISTQLKLLRRVPIPAGAEALGFVWITADERGIGTDDFAVFLASGPAGGKRRLNVEYWAHDRARALWSRSVVLESDIAAAARPTLFELTESGVRMGLSDGRAIELELGSRVGNYRARALDSRNPSASLTAGP